MKLKTKKSKPNHSLDYTIKRIAQICVGINYIENPIGEETTRENHPEIWLKENGSYVLGSGNNWFLSPDKAIPEDGNYFYWNLDYRYGFDDESQKALASAAHFIEWSFR